MINRRIAISWIGALTLTGCKGGEGDYRPEFAAKGEEARKEYSFAVHPLHNPQMLDRLYGPLVEHVNARLSGAKLRLVTSRDYEAYGARLNSEEFDFALPNPLQTLEAQRHGYRVFGKMSGDERFRGLILVRKDSGIAELGDLTGKVISYPARTALAGTMLPQYFLQTNGVDVVGETTTRYVGSQESAIKSVYLKTSDAAATWPLPWESYAREHPSEAAMLEVRWRTAPLVNNSLMVHRSTPPDLAAKVSEILFALDDSAEGRSLLEVISVSGFEPADAGAYRPVETFVETFERAFGAAYGVRGQ